jgi:hypothetical protein
MRPNVAVFAGVLEYVKDLRSVVLWLSGQVSYCVASYECASDRARGVTLARFREDFHRAKYGYMSRYTEAELIALFARFGFVCARVETWNDQRLFLFQITPPLPK